jgi:hypothetical protein
MVELRYSLTGRAESLPVMARIWGEVGRMLSAAEGLEGWETVFSTCQGAKTWCVEVARKLAWWQYDDARGYEVRF